MMQQPTPGTPVSTCQWGPCNGTKETALTPLIFQLGLLSVRSGGDDDDDGNWRHCSWMISNDMNDILKLIGCCSDDGSVGND